MKIAQLNSPIADLTTFGGVYLTQLMRLSFIARGDLSRRFSLDSKLERTVYMLWFLNYAEEFFSLPEYFLIEPSWKLLHRFTSEYGQYEEAPLTTLQAALWLALPLTKVFDLSLADDRLRVEMLVCTSLLRPKGMPTIPLSNAAKEFAAKQEPSLPDDTIITVFMFTVWQARADLQQAFPLNLDEGRKGLSNWFKTHGASELDLAVFDDETGTVETRWQNAEELLPKVENTQEEPTGSELAPGINVIGSAFGGSGMAKQAQMTVLAAASVGFPSCLVDHGIKSADPVPSRIPANLVSPKAKYFANVSSYNADAFPNFISKMSPTQLESAYNIYYGNWEYPDYPNSYREIVKTFDEVWAPSAFTLANWQNCFACPVIHMPMAVTVLPSGGRRRDYFGLPHNKYLFLFAFDYWSWIERKNPRALLDAFRLAFPRGNESAALVIKTKNVNAYNPSASQHWEYIKQAADADRRIIIIDENLDDSELHDLMRVCDAYVSLHRAEGFGFTIAESMLLAKPVIATDYSGNTEFTHANNSCLVDCRLVPVPLQHARELGIESTWADVDIEHAAFYMKRLHADASLGKQLGDAARQFVATNYDCRRVGRLIQERISTIYREKCTSVACSRSFAE